MLLCKSGQDILLGKKCISKNLKQKNQFVLIKKNIVLYHLKAMLSIYL